MKQNAVLCKWIDILQRFSESTDKKIVHQSLQLFRFKKYILNIVQHSGNIYLYLFIYVWISTWMYVCVGKCSCAVIEISYLPLRCKCKSENVIEMRNAECKKSMKKWESNGVVNERINLIELIEIMENKLIWFYD